MDLIWVPLSIIFVAIYKHNLEVTASFKIRHSQLNIEIKMDNWARSPNKGNRRDRYLEKSSTFLKTRWTGRKCIFVENGESFCPHNFGYRKYKAVESPKGKLESNGRETFTRYGNSIQSFINKLRREENVWMRLQKSTLKTAPLMRSFTPIPHAVCLLP